MVLYKFQVSVDTKTCQNNKNKNKKTKIIKMISTVLLNSKIYGEFAFSYQIIDLYKQIISFDENTKSKWRSIGTLVRVTLAIIVSKCLHACVRCPLTIVSKKCRIVKIVSTSVETVSNTIEIVLNYYK